MQAKPLALTILVLGLLALAADAWLAHSPGGSLAIEKSQVAPALPVGRSDSTVPDSTFIESAVPKIIFKEDALDASSLVSRNIQDLVLVASIEKRLFRASELRGVSFEVSSVNGDVELSGVVASEKTKQRALRLAQSVGGVRSVTNHIKVVLPSVTSEQDVE